MSTVHFFVGVEGAGELKVICSDIVMKHVVEPENTEIIVDLLLIRPPPPYL